MAGLAGYLAALADLAHPKNALTQLYDNLRLAAFEAAIAAALRQQPGTHFNGATKPSC